MAWYEEEAFTKQRADQDDKDGGNTDAHAAIVRVASLTDRGGSCVLLLERWFLAQDQACDVEKCSVHLWWMAKGSKEKEGSEGGPMSVWVNRRRLHSRQVVPEKRMAECRVTRAGGICEKRLQQRTWLRMDDYLYSRRGLLLEEKKA